MQEKKIRAGERGREMLGEKGGRSKEMKAGCCGRDTRTTEAGKVTEDGRG